MEFFVLRNVFLFQIYLLVLSYYPFCSLARSLARLLILGDELRQRVAISFTTLASVNSFSPLFNPRYNRFETLD
jgi:hypothetical protein